MIGADNRAILPSGPSWIHSPEKISEGMAAMFPLQNAFGPTVPVARETFLLILGSEKNSPTFAYISSHKIPSVAAVREVRKVEEGDAFGKEYEMVRQ